MSSAARRYGDRAAAWADAARRPALRHLMKVPWLRKTYLSRPARHALHFALSFAVAAVCAVLAPTVSLIVAPLVFGVAHLAASWRYSLRLANAPAAVSLPLSILAAVTIARLAIDLGWVSAGAVFEAAPEWVALAVTLLWLRAKNVSSWAGFAILVGAAARFPLATLGGLLLAHPVVAFWFWWKAAPRGERWVPALASAGVLGAYAVVFAGGADAWLIGAYSPAWAESVFGEIELFFPGGSPELAARFACAYALGTSLHYFVWLKAIPEQCHASRAPTSFRQSLASLRRDLGGAASFGVFLAAVGFPLLWWWAGPELTRRAYLALAAYHGFMEIAAALATAPSYSRRMRSK